MVNEKQEAELRYGCKERKEDILAETLSVPFQLIKKFGNVKKEEWYNMLIFGDNLQALKHLKNLQDEGKLEKIKLVFIDPPFGTGDIYDASSGTPAYSNKLQGAQFLEFLRKRLVFLRELLAKDGSIYVRIDYHYGHYIKVLMDEIFDKENFRNEIVVNRTKGKKKIGESFSHMVDSVFLYSKNNKLNVVVAETLQFRAINDILSKIKSKEINKDKLKKILYEVLWVPLDHRPGERITSKERIVFGKKFDPPKGRHWIKSQKKLDQLFSENKLRLKCKSCGQTHYSGRWKKCSKCGKDEPVIEILLDSEILSDNWTDIPGYSQRSGYPTENSEELLERVIRASSKEGDLVLDCFAGSGTAGAVAEKLKRRWVMVDSSKYAIYTMIKRLHNLKEKIGNKGKSLKPKPFVLYNAGLYLDQDFIKTMQEDDYKKFALELFQAQEKEEEINGFKFQGILNNRSVHVFSQKNYLTYDFIDDLHKTVGSALKDSVYIIVPQSAVRFNEDYVDRGNIRYHILKIPYSLIQEILNKGFTRIQQVTSKKELGTPRLKNVLGIGFDFIYPPEIKCKYYRIKPKGKITGYIGGEDLIIEIKTFEPVQITKKPEKIEHPISMMLIDRDYNGEFFNMTDSWFGDDIEKKNGKIEISGKVGKKIMIIYIDVLGNEKVEIKSPDDFKKVG